MAIRTIFLAVFSIFRFASFAENLKGEDDKEFFVLVSALRSVNVFPYALLLDVDLIDKSFVVFAQIDQLMPTSFLLTRRGHFFFYINTNLQLFLFYQRQRNRREASTPASTVDRLHRYFIQIFTIFKPPPAYHFPPKLSQKNAYSAYSD